MSTPDIKFRQLIQGHLNRFPRLKANKDQVITDHFYETAFIYGREYLRQIEREQNKSYVWPSPRLEDMTIYLPDIDKYEHVYHTHKVKRMSPTFRLYYQKNLRNPSPKIVSWPDKNHYSVPPQIKIQILPVPFADWLFENYKLERREQDDDLLNTKKLYKEDFWTDPEKKIPKEVKNLAGIRNWHLHVLGVDLSEYRPEYDPKNKQNLARTRNSYLQTCSLLLKARLDPKGTLSEEDFARRVQRTIMSPELRRVFKKIDNHIEKFMKEENEGH